MLQQHPRAQDDQADFREGDFLPRSLAAGVGQGRGQGIIRTRPSDQASINIYNVCIFRLPTSLLPSPIAHSKHFTPPLHYNADWQPMRCKGCFLPWCGGTWRNQTSSLEERNVQIEQVKSKKKTRQSATEIYRGVFSSFSLRSVGWFSSFFSLLYSTLTHLTSFESLLF